MFKKLVTAAIILSIIATSNVVKAVTLREAVNELLKKHSDKIDTFINRTKYYQEYMRYPEFSDPLAELLRSFALNQFKIPNYSSELGFLIGRFAESLNAEETKTTLKFVEKAEIEFTCNNTREALRSIMRICISDLEMENAESTA